MKCQEHDANKFSRRTREEKAPSLQRFSNVALTQLRISQIADSLKPIYSESAYPRRLQFCCNCRFHRAKIREIIGAARRLFEIAKKLVIMRDWRKSRSQVRLNRRRTLLCAIIFSEVNSMQLWSCDLDSVDRFVSLSLSLLSFSPSSLIFSISESSFQGQPFARAITIFALRASFYCTSQAHLWSALHINRVIVDRPVTHRAISRKVDNVSCEVRAFVSPSRIKGFSWFKSTLWILFYE